MPESIRRIEKFMDTSIEFHELDLLDRPGLEKIFKKVRSFLPNYEQLVEKMWFIDENVLAGNHDFLNSIEMCD